MPQPTVLSGPPRAITEEPFFSRVVEWCRDVRRASGLRYIVPTARRRRAVEDAILERCPEHSALCRPPVETLDRFAQNLFRASESSRLVSWRVATLIIEFLLTNAPDNFLTLRAERPVPFPGLARALVRSIRELRRFAVRPEALAKTASSRDPKASELALLYRRYCELLAKKGWSDPQDCLLVVGERLEDTIFREAALAPLRWTVFDGFVEFSPAELAIVHALVEQLETTFLLDSDPALPELFPAMEELARALGTQPQPRRDKGPFADLAGIAVLASPHTPRSKLPSVSLMESRTREDEVACIARTVKAHLLDGAAQDNIAVVVPNLGEYSALIEEIFPAHGVPYFTSREASLLECPVVAAALMLLETPARGFERSDLVRLFQSPFVHFEKDGHDIDPSALDEAARALRIFRGKQAWMQSIERQITYLERERQDPEFEPDDEASEADTRSLAHRPKRLRQLAQPLNEALDLLDELRQPRPVSRYVASLREIIGHFGIEKRTMHLLAEEPASAKHAQYLSQFHLILDELELVDQVPLAPHDVSLAQFIETLRSSVAATRASGLPRQAGIEVIEIDEAADFGHRVVFLGGLVEKAIPAPVEKDPILGPSIRRQLGLPDAERLAALNRLALYRAIASTTDTLVLSRPTREGETELLPPMLLERIQSAVALEPAPDPLWPTSRRSLLGRLGEGDAGLPPVEALLSHSLFSDDDSMRSFAHARHVEQARQKARETPTPYAGFLSEHLRDDVRRAYDEQHEYSASELETYVSCPFRFFAARLLRLAEIIEPEEEITPLHKGSVLHTIFREFYSEWLRRTGGGITEENRADALVLLTNVAARRLDELPYRGLIWRKFRERLLGYRTADERPVPGLFERFVEVEVHSGRLPTACTPQYFELGFGHQRHPRGLDPHSREAPLVIETRDRHILLQGVIDRIDVNAEDRTFCVLDYKSGSTTPSVAALREGLSLQLPVYVMAAKEFLGEDYRFAAAGYFQTKDANACGKRNFFGHEHFAGRAVQHDWHRSFTLDDEQMDHLLAQERETIGRCVEGIEAGRCHVTTRGPDKAACRSCDYIHICRYDRITVQTFRNRT